MVILLVGIVTAGISIVTNSSNSVMIASQSWTIKHNSRVLKNNANPLSSVSLHGNGSFALRHCVGDAGIQNLKLYFSY